MPAPRGEADEFERLKTVLFSPEAARLAAAEAQIEDLQGYVGDAGKLETATAEILAGALRRAETARHRELAAAIAPVVVAAIRAEIHNSRDMMVEALYPITGRLVAAAVANAFRELLDTINQRLDQLVSTNQWRLRFRALATGRSVAEIALAEAQAAGYQRMLLLERGSGKLLAMWRPDGGHEDNPELISGMVAAISEFASSVLSEHHGELRSLDLGASQVYLRASSSIILAAESLGGANAKARKRLDAGFVDLVSRRDRGDQIGESDLADLAETSVAPKAPARASKLRWVVLGLAVLLALGWGLKGPVWRWRKAQEIEAAFAGALKADASLASFPLSLREDWSAGTVTIRGLAGSQAAVEALAGAVAPAAAPMSVVSQMAVVATPAELGSARLANAAEAEAMRGHQADLGDKITRLEADLTALKHTFAGLSDGVVAKLQGLESADAARRTETGDLARRIDASKTDLAAAQSRLDALKTTLGGLQARLDTQRPRIIEAAVVWFGDGDTLADPAGANPALDALAQAIRATGEGVRVVGYADESGGAQGNLNISQARAAKVVKLLVERGVPPSLLKSVGRGAQTPIADPTKDSPSRNRRVTFEPLFAQERAP